MKKNCHILFENILKLITKYLQIPDINPNVTKFIFMLKDVF